MPGTDGRAVLDAFGSYRDVLINGVANLQVLQDDLTGRITGDEQLRALYEQLKDTNATQACVRHILVQAGPGQSDATTGELIPPTEEEYEAALTEILGIGARLQGGEDFATVAGEVSDDVPTRASRRRPRLRARGQLLRVVRPGRSGARRSACVGAPVRSEYGYHLVLVTDRRTLTFEEMRDDLQAAVEAQSSEALQSWLTEAAQGAKVTVDPGAGTWDASSGLVKAVGAIDGADLDLTPEDPVNPSDDLKPSPSSTTTLLPLPPTTAAATDTTPTSSP